MSVSADDSLQQVSSDSDVFSGSMLRRASRRKMSFSDIEGGPIAHYRRPSISSSASTPLAHIVGTPPTSVPEEEGEAGRSHGRRPSWRTAASPGESTDKENVVVMDPHPRGGGALRRKLSSLEGGTIAAILSQLGQHIAAPKSPRTAQSDVATYIQSRTVRHLTHFQQAVVVLVILAMSANFAWHQVKLCLEENNWIRVINLAWLPCTCIFMLFSVNFVVGQMVCAVGPIAHMQNNSVYFSAVEAPPLPGMVLPSITIQMPLYKEDLRETVLPSLVSLEAAMLHYAKNGGVAKIFLNDDGLQLLSPTDKAERLRVYRAARNLGYVARPPHEFKARRGMFKKASNMNYCLNVSQLVARKMEEAVAANAAANAANADANNSSGGIHVSRLDPAAALEAVRQNMGNEFEAGGDVRVGDIILLVDSDTRVPVDCLSRVAGEFALSPELGFLQCRITPLRTSDNYWESMIAHFTEAIYDVGIAVSVSAGDVAPLVGHNAFLRWDALKRASWVDEKDHERKFWSEKHVSEDFDLALRVQTLGYVGRYCTYTGADFKEGVSLSAADEVTRLRKYAFGACEMTLNRLHDWPCKGPITELYWRFLTSSAIPWPTKLTLTGYLGTYLAMGFSVYGIISYLAITALYPALEEGLTSAFDVTITVMLVFGVVGLFGAATIRYRMGYSKSLCGAWWTQLVHMPVLTLFFGHVLFPISTAIFSYFLNIPLSWGATSKTSTRRSFWHEVGSTLHLYRATYLAMCLLGSAFGAYMWYFQLPWDDVRLVMPPLLYIGFHVLGPILLNPNILRGYY